MSASHIGMLACLDEPLQRVLADRLEHRPARLAVRPVGVAQQALVDQQAETVEQVDPETVAADSVDRRARHPSTNTPKRRYSARSSRRAGLAPLERRPQRLLAGREVTSAAGSRLRRSAPAEHARTSSVRAMASRAPAVGRLAHAISAPTCRVVDLEVGRTALRARRTALPLVVRSASVGQLSGREADSCTSTRPPCRVSRRPARDHRMSGSPQGSEVGPRRAGARRHRARPIRRPSVERQRRGHRLAGRSTRRWRARRGHHRSGHRRRSSLHACERGITPERSSASRACPPAAAKRLARPTSRPVQLAGPHDDRGAGRQRVWRSTMPPRCRGTAQASRRARSSCAARSRVLDVVRAEGDELAVARASGTTSGRACAATWAAVSASSRRRLPWRPAAESRRPIRERRGAARRGARSRARRCLVADCERRSRQRPRRAGGPQRRAAVAAPAVVPGELVEAIDRLALRDPQHVRAGLGHQDLARAAARASGSKTFRVARSAFCREKRAGVALSASASIRRSKRTRPRCVRRARRARHARLHLSARASSPARRSPAEGAQHRASVAGAPLAEELLDHRADRARDRARLVRKRDPRRPIDHQLEKRAGLSALRDRDVEEEMAALREYVARPAGAQARSAHPPDRSSGRAERAAKREQPADLLAHGVIYQIVATLLRFGVQYATDQ